MFHSHSASFYVVRSKDTTCVQQFYAAQELDLGKRSSAIQIFNWRIMSSTRPMWATTHFIVNPLCTTRKSTRLQKMSLQLATKVARTPGSTRKKMNCWMMCMQKASVALLSACWCHTAPTHRADLESKIQSTSLVNCTQPCTKTPIFQARK